MRPPLAINVGTTRNAARRSTPSPVAAMTSQIKSVENVAGLVVLTKSALAMKRR